ncbi:FtsX-like permease family protein [Paenibacillus algicola]|nr:FtsX-like permease family protein [Paenibacillus algicola]
MQSIVRNKVFSIVIIVVLVAAMLFPSATLMNVYSNYQDQQSSFYQGENYYLLNEDGISTLSWANARGLHQKLLEIEGVLGFGYGGNTAVQVFSKYTVEELPVRWANEDLLLFEGVDKEKLRVLQTHSDRIHITPKTAEKLLPAIHPQGEALELLGESLLVEEVYHEKAVRFDTLLESNMLVSPDNVSPTMTTAVIQFSSFSQSVYDEVLDVLKSYNPDASLSSYEAFKAEEMAQANKSHAIAIVLCILLWLFTLVNIISLLVYKFERDHLKWSLMFVFGGGKRSVYRQIYVELFVYTFCAYILMLPLLYVLKLVMEQVNIPLDMSLSVVSGIIAIAMGITIIFGYIWIRSIDLRNLHKELHFH